MRRCPNHWARAHKSVAKLLSTGQLDIRRRPSDYCCSTSALALLCSAINPAHPSIPFLRGLPCFSTVPIRGHNLPSPLSAHSTSAMYIPVVSSYASASGQVLDDLLPKRSPVPEPKGGGGHGGGGHGGGGHGGGGYGSSSHGSGSGSEGGTGSTGSHASSAPLGSKGSTIPVSGSASSRSSATLYGSGDSRVTTIPQGQPFAGRSVGGGTRDGVYGSSYVVFGVCRSFTMLIHFLRHTLGTTGVVIQTPMVDLVWWTADFLTTTTRWFGRITDTGLPTCTRAVPRCVHRFNQY